MQIRFLLDTHILTRWIIAPRKLSRDQLRILDDTVRRGLQVGVSAMSLIEIAMLGASRKLPYRDVNGFFEQLDTNPAFHIISVTTEIAREITALGGSLRDPGDQTIVATARVHRLQLLTSDQRIIDSGLVSVIE